LLDEADQTSPSEMILFIVQFIGGVKEQQPVSRSGRGTETIALAFPANFG